MCPHRICLRQRSAGEAMESTGIMKVARGKIKHDLLVPTGYKGNAVLTEVSQRRTKTLSNWKHEEYTQNARQQHSAFQPICSRKWAFFCLLQLRTSRHSQPGDGGRGALHQIHNWLPDGDNHSTFLISLDIFNSNCPHWHKEGGAPWSQAHTAGV